MTGATSRNSWPLHKKLMKFVSSKLRFAFLFIYFAEGREDLAFSGLINGYCYERSGQIKISCLLLCQLSTNERNAEEGGNTGMCIGGMKGQEEIP